MTSFVLSKFSECDIEDSFFDSLKADYPGFEQWFQRKASSGEHAYTYHDGDDLQAFLYIKSEECEDVGELGCQSRMKIGTMKICDDSKGRRFGEGAVGIALWKWQESPLNQIYLTVYEKHSQLIDLLKDFGFVEGGRKGNEIVLYKDKKHIDYSNPKRSFPYINPKFERGGYIPIEATYHDVLFQYSELRNISFPLEMMTAASNGITKVYIATPMEEIDYAPGDIIFIYRISDKGKKTYTSALTSFCSVLNFEPVKKNGVKILSLDSFILKAGNKTALNEEELKKYYMKNNVYIITLTYNGFFGSGNNINHFTLKNNGLFETYPYKMKLDRDQVLRIIEMGKKDVQSLIIDPA